MRHLHVLHVDDDSELRTIVQISLELDPQLLVRSVGSSREALSIFREPDNPIPDLLLLDHRIGEASGVDLLYDIRNELRLRGLEDIPTAFLTGTLMKGEVQMLLGAGAIGVLTKPFNPLTLAEEARALLGE